MQSEINTMKVYIYYRHIIALIISLGQNMSVQNVIIAKGLYFFTLFSVLCLSFIHGLLPWINARGRKTDHIINMANKALKRHKYRELEP